MSSCPLWSRALVSTVFSWLLLLTVAACSPTPTPQSYTVEIPPGAVTANAITPNAITPNVVYQVITNTPAPATDTPPATHTPSATNTPLRTPTPRPTTTPVLLPIVVTSSLPPTMRGPIETWVKTQSFNAVGSNQPPDLSIGTTASKGGVLLAERVYVVADWFPSFRSGISSADLKKLWQGQPTADGLDTLLVTDATANALVTVLGAPGATVNRVDADSIIPQLWKDASAIAILPFDQLSPKVTALPLDGFSPLAKDFQVDRYPLVVRFWVNGDAKKAQALVIAVRPKIATTNRDPGRMTTLIMTGVTAMARGTALTIEQTGDPAYPARKIAPVLAAADITAISNEIPFVDDCQPSTDFDTLILCSKPSYLAALKLAGANIVGLTGNHMLDFGQQAFLKTLDLYKQNGIKYYAGGRNQAEAGAPLIVQDHGNKLAFLGANSAGPPNDWADATTPGAQRYDRQLMKQEIASAHQQADLVFVEYQADESYAYEPDANNQQIFRATLSDGADVITGVQSHVAQALEFGADGRHLILYGLGNLFFDQMFSDMVRQGIIVRHTIYQGRLLQTELLTTMLENYAQPRWATPEEREKILRAVFAASGWKVP